LAFLKKWWVESDFKAPNLPLSLRFKGTEHTQNTKDQVTRTPLKTGLGFIYWILALMKMPVARIVLNIHEILATGR
jgi:hypothetical protein